MSNYFIDLVGKGLTLSSRDLDLVRSWETAGIPAGLICRALRTAAANHREHRRFRLADCETLVQRLAHNVSTADVGQPTQQRQKWTRAVLLKRLAQVGASAQNEILKETYRRLYRQVLTLDDGALTVDDVASLDERAVSALLVQLPKAQRRAIEKAAMLDARSSLDASTSQAAQQRFEKAKIEQNVCETFALVLPSSILLEEAGP